MKGRERETGVIVRQRKERNNGKKEWRRGNGERGEADKERVNWIWERDGMVGRNALGQLVRRRKKELWESKGGWNWQRKGDEGK